MKGSIGTRPFRKAFNKADYDQIVKWEMTGRIFLDESWRHIVEKNFKNMFHTSKQKNDWRLYFLITKTYDMPIDRERWDMLCLEIEDLDHIKQLILNGHIEEPYCSWSFNKYSSDVKCVIMDNLSQEDLDDYLWMCDDNDLQYVLDLGANPHKVSERCGNNLFEVATTTYRAKKFFELGVRFSPVKLRHQIMFTLIFSTLDWYFWWTNREESFQEDQLFCFSIERNECSDSDSDPDEPDYIYKPGIFYTVQNGENYYEYGNIYEGLRKGGYLVNTVEERLHLVSEFFEAEKIEYKVHDSKKELLEAGITEEEYELSGYDEDEEFFVTFRYTFPKPCEPNENDVIPPEGCSYKCWWDHMDITSNVHVLIQKYFMLKKDEMGQWIVMMASL